MPRLSCWFLGALASLGLTYGGYYHVYIPQQTVQVAADQLLEGRKKPLQAAIQAYSRLQAAIEQQVAITPSSLPSASRRQDTSAWHTNAEKIIFFCGVQRMRALLLGLPLHVMTEKDLRGRLLQLSVWETLHCTELNFRTTPLSGLQTFRCATCFVAYLLCFHVLTRVFRMWGGSWSWQAWMQHTVAKRIIEALEIQVSLTTESMKPCGSCCPATCGSSRRYITLNTTHWIEEVGFWACPNNPLLHIPACDSPKIAQCEDVDNCRLELLRGVPSTASLHPTSGRDLRRCHPSRSATTYITTYAEHWRRLEALELERLSKGSEKHEVRSLMKATRVSIGYPVLSDTSKLECDGDHKVHYIPVGISGLPHLLYVDAVHAKADVRPQETREETYSRVQRAQFVRKHAPGSRKSVPADSTTAIEPLATSRWHKWQAQGTFPCWHKVWWGGVYGGRSRRSTTSLHYHLGSPSTATEYASAAMEASQAAEAFAAHSAL